MGSSLLLDAEKIIKHSILYHKAHLSVLELMTRMMYNLRLPEFFVVVWAKASCNDTILLNLEKAQKLSAMDFLIR